MRPPSRLSRALLALALLLVAPLAAAADSRPVVALLPLGTVDPEYLQRISAEIQARMNVEVRIEPARAFPTEAYYAPRHRWRAEKLLAAIDAKPPEGAWKVLAVTEAEISTTKDSYPDWRVAGLGNLGGRSCVVSAFIYKKHSRNRAELLRRLADTAVHEFGHTLGLDHCEVPGCVMSDAEGKVLESTDRSTGQFCAKCRERLPPADRALLKQP